jgi:hypothetical protein
MLHEQSYKKFVEAAHGSRNHCRKPTNVIGYHDGCLTWSFEVIKFLTWKRI